jgi:hypothetical protein
VSLGITHVGNLTWYRLLLQQRQPPKNDVLTPWLALRVLSEGIGAEQANS